MLPTTTDYHRIITDGIPLIDVRAPIEFTVGAFPNTVNLPLMNDNDRHQVGICYKRHGQTAAIALGHKLVSGQVKEERIGAWCTYIEAHPDAIIYCFRGGLRSRLSQEWANTATGHATRRLEGGYKAFRQYLLSYMNANWLSSVPLVLGGRTGVGKTTVIKQLDNSIDLEGIANHRGSSFGHYVHPPATQIAFEHGLAFALIRHQAQGHPHMIVEDEGRHVGKCFLSKELTAHFASSDVVELEAPFEARLESTFNEYVREAQASYQRHFRGDGFTKWQHSIEQSVHRIKKRLGGERCTRVLQQLNAACAHQQAQNDQSLHKQWIEILLTEYYDPMYSYQLKQKQQHITFRGNASEVLEFLRSL